MAGGRRRPRVDGAVERPVLVALRVDQRLLRAEAARVRASRCASDRAGARRAWSAARCAAQNGAIAAVSRPPSRLRHLPAPPAALPSRSRGARARAPACAARRGRRPAARAARPPDRRPGRAAALRSRARWPGCVSDSHSSSRLESTSRSIARKCARMSITSSVRAAIGTVSPASCTPATGSAAARPRCAAGRSRARSRGSWQKPSYISRATDLGRMFSCADPRVAIGEGVERVVDEVAVRLRATPAFRARPCAARTPRPRPSAPPSSRP